MFENIVLTHLRWAKIGGSNSITMYEQVPVIYLISCKLKKLQICYIHHYKDILQSFCLYFCFLIFYGKSFMVGFVSTCTDQVVS